MLADESGNGHNGLTNGNTKTLTRKNIFSNGPIMGEWANGADVLAQLWLTDPRWQGITRPYSADDVVKLRGSVPITHTLAKRGAERLWYLINRTSCAVARHVSNIDAAMHSVCTGDMVLHLRNSAHLSPINSAFLQADRAAWATGQRDVFWFAPIIANISDTRAQDAISVFSQVQVLIEQGAAAVAVSAGASTPNVYKQQVLAARLAADAMGTPTLIIARAHTVSHALIAAPIADVIWFDYAFANLENLNTAQHFADAVHAQAPGKSLGCDLAGFDAEVVSSVQRDLCSMGYRLQLDGNRGPITAALPPTLAADDILRVVAR